MKRWIGRLGWSAMILAVVGCVEASPTSQDIELRTVVDASPEEVIADWTNETRVNAFLGVTSRIEPMVGGAYEIGFLPPEAAAAEENATVGARILALEPDHLAFEWRVPPWAEETVRSAASTRVDLRVRPAGDHPAAGGGTILHLRHSGFGSEPAWADVRSFFQWQWLEILGRYRVLKEEP